MSEPDAWDDVELDTCAALSLNEYPCILVPGHEGDHERYDGRRWPDGQAWADVIDLFFRSQGIDPDNPKDNPA